MDSGLGLYVGFEAGRFAIGGERAATNSRGPWLFPSTRGAVRDPSTVRRSLAAVVHGTEWQGLHPHAFRHLVATRLDAAGLTAREIADYLGHEQISMTQDVYMSRRATGSAAAAALEQLHLLAKSHESEAATGRRNEGTGGPGR